MALIDQDRLSAAEARVRAEYASAGRHYHDVAHLDDCLAKLEAEDVLPDVRRRLRWAILWHDVVYDPTRSDNEERSAERAQRELAEAGVADEDAAEIARLILLTRGHAVAAEDEAGALLVSIDLSILGAEPARYDAYARAIRQEYGHVPEDAYRAGRSRVLRHFLEAAAIFPNAGYRGRYEAQARENLAREAAALEE
jgi:predicted metal-dependent HD superfamily phosphohydrolase